ncbi:MAG: hypothetical protein L0241_07950 [Planctomycetia bacterium]|nr:hypothetical protein [Planctomycetia bacterium]
MTEAEWLAATDPGEMLIASRFASDQPRKFALFAFAGYRLIWDCLDEATQKWVAAVEQNEAAHWNAEDDWKQFELRLQREEVGVSCLRELQPHASQSLHSQASDLVREIFGNPFRPVVVEPSWLTSDVVALAAGIYEDRAFDRMPILADALQDAGCDNNDILNHCRGEGPHVRGCWVIDALLGKA